MGLPSLACAKPNHRREAPITVCLVLGLADAPKPQPRETI
jgi:hypothetical protein